MQKYTFTSVISCKMLRQMITARREERTEQQVNPRGGRIRVPSHLLSLTSSFTRAQNQVSLQNKGPGLGNLFGIRVVPSARRTGSQHARDKDTGETGTRRGTRRNVRGPMGTRGSESFLFSLHILLKMIGGNLARDSSCRPRPSRTAAAPPGFGTSVIWPQHAFEANLETCDTNRRCDSVMC